MESYENQPQETHLFEDNPYHLVQAGIGKRIANYFIDLFFFTLLAFIALIITANVNLQVVENFVKKSETGFTLPEQLLMQLIYGTYLFITETIFKGKTLGKRVTGTRAVNAIGNPVGAKEAMLRGLIRMIPFEQFSALGNPSYPWHDRWAKTYVIDEKKSNYPA